MSKAIRVIDLLNKIANGEELPKRIKTNNRIYHYCPSCDTYEDEKEKDIQSIEDIKDVFIENSTCGEDVKYLARKYNEILKWAKQLDKKIKEK